MPQLLLEILSEEIPARMQAQAARDLARMAAERLKAQALAYDELRTFAGPRRLTLVVDGLPMAQADRAEEIKGPKASAPPQALEGFLRKTGLAREDLIERDGVLYATTAHAGRETPVIASEMVGEIMRAFPWPKSMRSGVSSFRWVRPVKGVLLVFDSAVVPFDIDGHVAGSETRGHRFMGSCGAPFAVTAFSSYAEMLEREFVILDAAERKRRILEGAREVCDARGLELVEDEGLLDEVAGLAEWPVPVLGDMDPAFLTLPPEAVRTSMRTHQKYFSVRTPGKPGLAPHFVVVANVEASDGGAALATGNAKVLSARLNDARFFWDEDRKAGAFARWNEKLKGVTFHAKLGSMAERVERIAALAREIAPAVGADPDLAETAARLCKADLASMMVGEFPELQGIMGGYYVREAGFRSPLDAVGLDGPEPESWFKGLTPGEVDAIADAVRDHYKPVGPSDSVPTAPITVAVALADKLDTLVGFFAVDEKPTGSRDPYALRRAALGVIRLVLAGRHRLSILSLGATVTASIAVGRNADAAVEVAGLAGRITAMGDNQIGEQLRDRALASINPANAAGLAQQTLEWSYSTSNSVLSFFADRLKVQLRDEGRRHDLVDAVFALGDDDLVRITAKVEALSAFLATEDGANLLAGYKRAANILKAEAKKNADEVIAGEPALQPVSGPEERDLLAALARVQAELEPKLAVEDFTGAMASLATLRAPVDAFFDRVLVNDPNLEVRLNRLRLLQRIQDAANRVADFSLIQG